MIDLKFVRWKNFLSTGNNFTEIDIKNSKTTLVVGTNGSGKSTFVDALSYALFGKPHRKIKLMQLVNSLNQKDMKVEVEFKVHESEYKVVRGLKPTVFEIWKDGVLLNQDSHSKKYQKILEQNILKHNHKSFHQVEVLSSSRFVAFMQLSAWQRREVIEDLLDINVFSRMNGILKEKNSNLKDSIKENRHEIELIDTKIESQRSHISELRDLTSEYARGKEKEIVEYQKEIKSITKQIESFSESPIDKYRSEKSESDKKLSSIESYSTQFKKKQRELLKEIEFYESNETCPTCEQDIDEKFREEKISESKCKHEKFEEGKFVAQKEITELMEVSGKLEEKINEELIKISAISSLQNNITNAQRRIEVLQKELARIHEEDDNISNAEEILVNLRTQKDNLSRIKHDLADQREYYLVIQELLKDSGIKTKVIKQYLPVINKFLNQYLRVLDFYVHFELDESFKETIRSRHRDEFSYDSFSEGEKMRIDMALLFTWRQIAKMKNSVSTNMLVLDETFDSSLDDEGVENLLKILDTIDDGTNVFVISHKPDLMRDTFDRTITFSKEKNFSQYDEAVA